MFPLLMAGFDYDAARHFGRMTSTDASLRNALNSLIISLKTASLWDKIDVLCVVHDNSADSLLNLKGINDSTTVGSPTFTADVGFKAEGSAKYVDIGLTDTTAPSMGIYDAHFMTYVNSHTLGGLEIYFESDNSGSDANLAAYWALGPNANPAIRGIGAFVGTDIIGFSGASCLAIDERHYISNDSINTDVTSSASSLATTTYKTKGGTGNYAVHSAWGIGSGLTTIELGAYEDAVRAYMQARGADVY